MFLKVKRTVCASAAAILIVAVFAWGILENTYVNYPRSPDPQDGRVVPHPVKGVIVYITEGQSNLLSWLMWVGVGSGAIAVLVTLIHRGDPFRNEHSLGQKLGWA
jgi:hypothetical protein